MQISKASDFAGDRVVTVTPERAGYLVGFGPTDQIFMHPHKQVTGWFG